MINRYLKWLDYIFLGSLVTLHRANKIVSNKIKHCDESHFVEDNRLQHSKEILHNRLNNSIERLERIENKAMSTLLGVGIAIAVFGAAAGILGTDGILSCKPLLFRLIAAGLIFFSMAYLIGSGLLALAAYKIGQVYRPTLNDLVPVAEENHEKIATLFAIEQNQRAATLRSNRLSAAFAYLRNGLITVVMLGAFTIAVGFPAKTQKDTNNSLKPTVTYDTHFAGKAKLEPRYGGLVPPLYSNSAIKNLCSFYNSKLIHLLQYIPFI